MTEPSRATGRLLLSVLVAGILWCGIERAHGAPGDDYRLRLTANPVQVPADGKTSARVRIEVRRADNRLATEDVEIVVNTTFGSLSLDGSGGGPSLQVRANGGIATVFASSNTPGLATVTGWVRDQRNSVSIRFLPEGQAATPIAKVIHVRGEWVGYSVDNRVIQARENASVRLGDLEFLAEGGVDVDLDAMSLRANSLVADGVSVKSGDAEISGQDLYFDLNTRRGVIIGERETGMTRHYFDAYDLTEKMDEWDLPANALAVDDRETATWLIADSMSYFIGEKLVLRHGSAWVDTRKVMGFPKYWIVGMPGYSGSTNNKILNVNSTGGVAVDFPFFYAVSDTTTSAVKIQRGTDAAYTGVREGWSLAWQREYRGLGDNYEGTIEVGGLPTSNWGVQWRDQRGLGGNATSYLNVISPDHQSVFTDATVYQYTGSGRYNYRGYFDAPEDSDKRYGLVADWLSNSHPAWGSTKYRMGLSLGGERSTRTQRMEFGSEVYGELDWGTHRFGRSTSLRPTLQNRFSWDTGGYSANSVRANLDLRQQLGSRTSFSVDYSAEYFTGDSSITGLEQLLSLDLNSYRGKWYLYAYGSRNITFKDTFAYMNLSFYPSSTWRWGLSGTYYDFKSGDTYDEWVLSVGRMFGQREIGVSYNEETGRISLDLNGFATF